MSTPLQPAPMTSTNPVQPSNPGSAPGSMAQPPSNPASMPAPPAAQPVGFDADVHPILVDRCGNCHGADQMDLPQHGAASADASFNALRGMSRGEPVYQRVLARASGADPMGFMPPPYANCRGPLGTGDCLTEDEFDLTAAWVEQGATRR